MPNRDSLRSFGHALRVRRDGIDADDNDVEKFVDDENIDWEALNGNQVNGSKVKTILLSVRHN